MLEARDLHAAYQKDLYILKGLNLSVPIGKITIVIGPNGSGKSTLLKSICGILKPQKGSVWLDHHGCAETVDDNAGQAVGLCMD